MELDVVGYNPHTGDLVHYEPSIDAHNWEVREARFKKKFESAKKYIFSEVFSWLPATTSLRQVAVLINHPKERNTLAGGLIVSIDELLADIRREVIAQGPTGKNAIPELYPLLRTLQLSHCGYWRVV